MELHDLSNDLVDSVSTSEEVVAEYPDELSERFGLRFQLVSAEELRRGSAGEVQSSKILSDEKHSFHPQGLFSETIFGPATRWNQHDSNRASPLPFGHIELPVPVFHPLFLRGIAGRAVRAALGVTEHLFDMLLNGSACVVTDAADSQWLPGMLVNVEEYHSAIETSGPGLKALFQAEAVRWLLQRANVDAAIDRVRLHKTVDSRVMRLIRTWFKHGVGTDGLVLDVLPVISPVQRPMQWSARGKPRRHDLTCLYQKVLLRCRQLRKLNRLEAPSMIRRHFARLLQTAVDNLLVKPSQTRSSDRNSRQLQPLVQCVQQSLKPYCDQQGTKPRTNSIRLPVVPSPRLPSMQCGLPRNAATLSLLAPIWFAHCKETGLDLEQADWQLRYPDARVWSVLERAMPTQAVLLTIQASRSRASLQAFQPVLVDGRAVQLSPIAIQALRGESLQDDVSVFWFSSRLAASNALVEMLPDQLRNPADGQFLYKPTLDMVLGCFELTRDPLPVSEKSWEPVFLGTTADVVIALENGVVSRNSEICLRLDHKFFCEQPLGAPQEVAGQRVRTTPGRIVFNACFPEELPFVNYAITRDSLTQHLHSATGVLGDVRTRELLDRLQATATAVLTRMGSSICQADLAPPSMKSDILAAAHKESDRQRRNVARGFATGREAFNNELEVWTKANEQLKDQVAIHVLAASENRESMFPAVARTSAGMDWLRHLCGMVGFILGRSGEFRGPPVTANWGEGLGVIDYWQVVRLQRIVALSECERTQEADTNTRSLLEAMQGGCVTLADCGTTEGIEIRNSAATSLSDVLVDRVSCEDVGNPVTGAPIVCVGQRITAEVAWELESLNVPKLRVRSPATCEAEQGICQQCYGRDKSTAELVQIGTPVGVVAAFALGEYAHNPISSWRFGGRSPSRRFDDGSPCAWSQGTIHFPDLRTVLAADGTFVAMHLGKIDIRDRNQLRLQSIEVPKGARILFHDGVEVRYGDKICSWDPDVIPLLAEHAGRVAFFDIVPGVNCQNLDNSESLQIVTFPPYRGSMRPHLVILDEEGQPSEAHYLVENMVVPVKNGQAVTAGDTLGLLSRPVGLFEEMATFGDLTVLLSAGPTQNTSALAPVDGIVDSVVRFPGGQKIVLRNAHDECDFYEIDIGDSGTRVDVGSKVAYGDPLSYRRQINPHDVNRIMGLQGLIQHLLGVLQRIFRHNRISIDSKHLELVIRHMTSRVKIDASGDTDFMAGDVIGLREYRRENDRISQLVCITESATPEFTVGQLVRRDAFEKRVGELTSQNVTLPKARHARPAFAMRCLTSIQELARSRTRKTLFGKIDIEDLAQHAVTGEVQSIDRLAHHVLLQPADLADR